MSLLIKGLNLPEKIEGEMVFEFIDDMSGKLYARIYDYKFGGLINCCEVVPIPPHRKLIDADALMKFIETLYDATWDEGYAGACVDILERITTSISIPAEESENKE